MSGTSREASFTLRSCSYCVLDGIRSILTSGFAFSYASVSDVSVFSWSVPWAKPVCIWIAPSEPAPPAHPVRRAAEATTVVRSAPVRRIRDFIVGPSWLLTGGAGMRLVGEPRRRRSVGANLHV